MRPASAPANAMKPGLLFAAMPVTMAGADVVTLVLVAGGAVTVVGREVTMVVAELTVGAGPGTVSVTV